MIGLCQEGKSSPDALRRSAGTISFRSTRVLASRPWFLLDIEPDFHLLSQPASGLHRRLSLCSPASLETYRREHRELALLGPVG
jgi:hypothetical protein